MRIISNYPSNIYDQIKWNGQCLTSFDLWKWQFHVCKVKLPELWSSLSRVVLQMSHRTVQYDHWHYMSFWDDWGLSKHASFPGISSVSSRNVCMLIYLCPANSSQICLSLPPPLPPSLSPTHILRANVNFVIRSKRNCPIISNIASFTKKLVPNIFMWN